MKQPRAKTANQYQRTRVSFGIQRFLTHAAGKIHRDTDRRVSSHRVRLGRVEERDDAEGHDDPTQARLKDRASGLMPEGKKV